jgi:hypothetical protein
MVRYFSNFFGYPIFMFIFLSSMLWLNGVSISNHHSKVETILAGPFYVYAGAFKNSSLVAWSLAGILMLVIWVLHYKRRTKITLFAANALSSIFFLLPVILVLTRTILLASE